MGGFAGSRKVRPGPARGVILSKDRARKASKRAGGGKLRGAWEIRFDVKREFAYDLDMRVCIDHYVSVAVMEHFRDSLKSGKTPGGRPLPRTKPKTQQQFGGGPIYGLRSGYMADHWWRGKIRGGPFRAFVLIKPYGGDGGPSSAREGMSGRAFMLKNALRRKPRVDFQSVRGPSRKVIQKGLDRFLDDAVGEKVRTPGRPNTREALLPQLRGGT